MFGTASQWNINNTCGPQVRHLFMKNHLRTLQRKLEFARSRQHMTGPEGERCRKFLEDVQAEKDRVINHPVRSSLPKKKQRELGMI